MKYKVGDILYIKQLSCEELIITKIWIDYHKEYRAVISKNKNGEPLANPSFDYLDKNAQIIKKKENHPCTNIFKSL